ncbi:MAG: DUF1549 and DUF1553 domain-containing protein [Gemmataceae bacterium]|nr:DUF1549 and DUF1553 domain-containing protein [Gemmataceae bacterium]
MLRKVALLFAALCAAPLAAEEPSFRRHVAPILYQLGCSAGGCHGSFNGKGGMQLSLFAGNPDADHFQLRAFGRRIDPLHPERSLLLQKPTGALPHEGGVRLKADSWQYATLKRWIENGAPLDSADAPKVLSVRVEPTSIVLPAGASPQSAKVIAKLSNHVEEDVTKYAKFESLDPGLAEVEADGKITSRRVGDVAVLGHYAGEVGFTTVLIPGPPTKLVYPGEKHGDAVDRLLVDRMKRLNIVPSGLCDDRTFLRRVTLDVTGQLPTPEDVRKFEADADPAKRAKLIDRLLDHPLHSAMWAGKMCDMVGADDRFIGDGVYNFHDWFRNKLEANTPWNRIAYGVLVATAADDREPAQILEDQKRDADEKKKAKEAAAKKETPPADSTAPWQKGYATRNTLDLFYNNLIHQQTAPKGRIIDSKKVALRAAHVFLGVRLECAQCHKHPYDRWSQADFFGFSTVFAHVDYGVDPVLKEKKVNLAGTHVAMKPMETFPDPVTQEPLPAKILGGPAIEVKAGVDPRRETWKWLIAKENPYFASAMANRLWGHYLGRGFVEPADAQAAANPPSHPEVLAELSRDFAKDFDLKKLHRRILNTFAYQRDWRTNVSNAKDDRNFSHHLLRRVTAEQALDAIAQITDTPIKLPKRFASPRDGQKAAEVAMSRVGGDDGYVLQIFGRPIRVQACDCERSAAVGLSQTMYLLNDEKLIAKIHDAKGRLKKLVDATPDDDRLIDELHLWTLTRTPTDEERSKAREFVREAGNRLEGYQDLLWALMNRNDFVINR